MVLGVNNNPYEADANNYRKESVKFDIGFERIHSNELTPGGAYMYSFKTY